MVGCLMAKVSGDKHKIRRIPADSLTSCSCHDSKESIGKRREVINSRDKYRRRPLIIIASAGRG